MWVRPRSRGFVSRPVQRGYDLVEFDCILCFVLVGLFGDILVIYQSVCVTILLGTYQQVDLKEQLWQQKRNPTTKN